MSNLYEYQDFVKRLSTAKGAIINMNLENFYKWEKHVTF